MTRPRGPLAAGVLALVLLGTSMGASESPAWTGRLAVFGNEPFTYLGLVDRQDKVWRLSGPLVKEMRQLQGLWVTVKGQPQGRDGILVESWVRVPEEKNP